MVGVCVAVQDVRIPTDQQTNDNTPARAGASPRPTSPGPRAPPGAGPPRVGPLSRRAPRLQSAPASAPPSPWRGRGGRACVWRVGLDCKVGECVQRDGRPSSACATTRITKHKTQRHPHPSAMQSGHEPSLPPILSQATNRQSLLRQSPPTASAHGRAPPPAPSRWGGTRLPAPRTPSNGGCGCVGVGGMGGSGSQSVAHDTFSYHYTYPSPCPFKNHARVRRRRGRHRDGDPVHEAGAAGVAHVLAPRQDVQQAGLAAAGGAWVWVLVGERVEV